MKKLCMIVLMVSLLVISCAHNIELKGSVKAGEMIGGQTYKAPMDGWFISDEGINRLLEMLNYYMLAWKDCEEGRLLKTVPN